MKLVAYMICKETKKLKSYRIYDMDLEELQKKADEHNKTNEYTEAKIVTDELTIAALDMKETNETIKGATENLMEDFRDLRNMVNNEVSGIEYALGILQAKVDDLVSEKHV